MEANMAIAFPPEQPIPHGWQSLSQLVWLAPSLPAAGIALIR
jgi:hypothetical protein